MKPDTHHIHRRRSLGLTDYPAANNHHRHEERPIHYLIVVLLCIAALAGLWCIVPALYH